MGAEKVESVVQRLPVQEAPGPGKFQHTDSQQSHTLYRAEHEEVIPKSLYKASSTPILKSDKDKNKN